MLDVHPPHEATHTWKDFFIHIATIVVGLLIAIGLEQTVEYIHHRREVAETREALHQEREQNHKIVAADTLFYRSMTEDMKNNLIVLTYLRQHPGTLEEKLPGILSYHANYVPAIESAWKTAQQTNVTDLMPRREIVEDADLYRFLDKLNAGTDELWHTVTKADEYQSVDPDLGHLTPAQVDEQIKRTQDCIEAIYRWGVNLENIGEDDKDFPSGPTFAELRAFIGITRSPTDEAKLAAARQLTMARVQAAQTAATAAAEAAQNP